MLVEKGVLKKAYKEDLLLLKTNPKKFWKRIKVIGRFAFYDCLELESITIPEGIKGIEESCFANCKNLKAVDIPDSVTRIGKSCFSGCENLRTIIIPSSVTIIEAQCFYDCKNLKEIKLPDSLVEISHGAFFGCESLEEITLPDKITSIGDCCFRECTKLESIVIPSSVTIIEAHCFSDCRSLKQIEIPQGVTNIDQGCFCDCESLESITLPDNITTLEYCCFRGCSSLQTVVIPKKVVSIGEGCFRYCEKLKTVEIPSSVINIETNCFFGCKSLETITIPSSVERIGGSCFSFCNNLAKVEISNDTIIGENIFNETNIKYIYFTKDGKKMIFTSTLDQQLEKIAYRKNADFGYDGYKLLSKNYRDNFYKLIKWKEEGKVKFVPPDYVLALFPTSEIKNFYLNKNNQRWGALIKTLKFDTLEGREKINSLEDLMKIYYCLGGFSDNQGESEKAFAYIVKYVATGNDAREEGENIHLRFSKLDIKGKYNPAFAEFFMKYYKDNPDFMEFELEGIGSQDYLCAAHNHFNNILQAYPNRSINGNEERALLSPRFVAEHCNTVTYENVNYGNELLAQIIGRYGYTQEQFERIQTIYEKAKKIKDNYVIKAIKSNKGPISFRVLEKDDPVGFVIGEITNCCQVIGGAGETCVDDGYRNPNAGFLVFEEERKDDKGELTGEKRILGQAYIWYDPVTKTICYDNIEVPTKILKRLKKDANISSKSFVEAVEESAEAIMLAMNKDERLVERVTVGKGYNDLAEHLVKRFGNPQTNPEAKHRSYSGYSDANEAQFLIKTYDEVTGKKSEGVRVEAETIRKDLRSIVIPSLDCSTDKR